MRSIATIWLMLISMIWCQQWQFSSPIPLAVAGAEAVATDTSIFLLGGSLTPVGIERSIPLIQEYSIRDGYWKCPDTLQAGCGSMQVGRMNFSAGLFNEKIYFAGGTAEFPYLFTMESWAFNRSATSHNVSPEFNRTNAAGLVHNGKFYLIGGFPATTDSLRLSYIIEYDIANGTIVYQEDSLYAGQNLPYDQMISLVGDDIYIFGGTRFGVFDDVFTFNTVTRQLTAATPINGVRAGGKAIVGSDNQVFVIGGYNEASSALQTVDLYDINNFPAIVTTAPLLQQARQNFAAVLAGGAIYVLGGFDAFGNPMDAVERFDLAVGLNVGDIKPENFRLYQNYPNPFNPQTTIEFDVPIAGRVKLEILDVLGRSVSTYQVASLAAGSHKYTWNGTDAAGNSVSSGIYYYRLSVDNNAAQIRKMVLSR